MLKEVKLDLDIMRHMCICTRVVLFCISLKMSNKVRGQAESRLVSVERQTLVNRQAREGD